MLITFCKIITFHIEQRCQWHQSLPLWHQSSPLASNLTQPYDNQIVAQVGHKHMASESPATEPTTALLTST